MKNTGYSFLEKKHNDKGIVSIPAIKYNEQNYLAVLKAYTPEEKHDLKRGFLKEDDSYFSYGYYEDEGLPKVNGGSLRFENLDDGVYEVQYMNVDDKARNARAYFKVVSGEIFILKNKEEAIEALGSVYDEEVREEGKIKFEIADLEKRIAKIEANAESFDGVGIEDVGNEVETAHLSTLEKRLEYLKSL